MTDENNKPVTVKHIIAMYLVEHGFDGLHGDDCGCLRNDLFPCDGCGIGQNMYNCIPARRVPCRCVDDCEWGQESLHMAQVTAEEAAKLWKEHKDGKETT